MLPHSAASRDGNGWRDMDGTAAMRNLIRDAPIRNCCASIEAAAVGAVKVRGAIRAPGHDEFLSYPCRPAGPARISAQNTLYFEPGA